MDKLMPIIQNVKKHHFWVLIALVMIAGLGAWSSASSQLSTEFEQNKNTIGSLVSELENIQRTPEHPNQDLIDGYKEQTQVLRAQVAKVWGNLYARQRKEVLTWPKELGPSFINLVEQKKFGEDLGFAHRENFQYFVKDRLQQLPQIVKAKVQSTRDEGDTGSTGSRSKEKPSDKDDQDYLLVWQGFESLEGKFHWEDRPSAMKVWVAQEDLWVYETLLGVIARTNVLARGPHNATVSVINALEVGQDAATGSNTSGRVMRVASTEEGDPGAAPPPEQVAPPPEVAAGSTAGPPLSRADMALVDKRYLDTNGVPLPGGQQSAVAEYKRIPIRMQLTMDPREIPRLLVECANAPLPVEVQQVRINPNERDLSRSALGHDGAPASKSREDDDEQRQVHVPIVVQGIIYIFNPPDLTKLGPQTADGEAPPVDPAAPAASVAAPVDAQAAPGTGPAAPAPAEAAPAEAAPVDAAAPGTAAPPGEAVPSGEAPVPGEIAPTDEATPAGEAPAEVPDAAEPGAAPEAEPPAVQP